MKHYLLFLLFTLVSTHVFPQGEFVIETYINTQARIIYRSKGCTADDGVIVFYTEIPNLKFSMPDTPKRLKKISDFDGNSYVLCIQPTDKTIGGISKYSIDIKAEGYIPVIHEVRQVNATEAQYFTIKQKTAPFRGTDNIYTVTKRKVLIARFSNETAYARGIFYDKENDPIGKQATIILSTKLASTNKFSLLEWNKNQEGWQIADYQKMGADFLVSGSITEFGRKNVSENRKKYQIAQASISIRLIDVSTGQIVFAEETKSEAKTDGDFDPTLGDQAISHAISKLVERINNLFK